MTEQISEEKDWDALAEKHLASIKRDMKISLEDATVRAAHKVMTEFNDIERQAQQRKESVMAAVHTLTEYQRGYEDGFIDGMQKQTQSDVTKMMNGGIRNDTIEEVAQHIEKLTGFGQDTISSFAIYIREMKK